MRNLFEILNKTFSKFYSSSEYLAEDEAIILLKRRIIFRKYVPEKQAIGVKVYKPCEETGCTYDMTVYFFLDGSEKFLYRYY
jgi:hypothetical protein